MYARQARKIPLIAALLATAMLLSACEGVKKQVGVGRNSPDEFAVVKRAPLTLPPDYNLRPPSADHTAPASDASDRARAALLGERTSATPDNADAAFLQKAGAQSADSDIRRVINRENGYIALENRTLSDRLLFWRESDVLPEDAPASVVNPAQEKERLLKNQEEGKPVNEGKVPVIEKKKGTIDRIF